MPVLDAPALAALLLLGPLPASLWNASACACQPPTRLDRALHGAGMHRQLNTSLELPGGESTQPACRLLLLQALPRGVAADPDELAAARRSGGPGWTVFGDSNRERPASECSASVAALELSARLTAPGLPLPLHARYPAPCVARPLVSTVQLPPPMLLQRCSEEEGGVWHPVPSLAEPAPALDWAVPCGDAAAEKDVLAVTSLVTLCSAGAVLLALARSQQSPPVDSRYL
jgi:PIG-X / PBN1